jgi:hypothetical protein
LRICVKKKFRRAGVLSKREVVIRKIVEVSHQNRFAVARYVCWSGHEAVESPESLQWQVRMHADQLFALMDLVKLLRRQCR